MTYFKSKHLIPEDQKSLTKEYTKTPDFIGQWDMPDPSICEPLLDEFHLWDCYEGVSGLGEDTKVRKEVKDSEDRYYSATFGDHPKIHLPVLQWLEECLKKYTVLYPSIDAVNHFAIIERYNLQSYEPDGGFKRLHCENASSNSGSRIGVWMIYLNTIQKGGGTFFPNQNITTDAVQGRTLIWPSYWTHVHIGVPAPKEKKYILTGWFSYVPNDMLSANEVSSENEHSYD